MRPIRTKVIQGNTIAEYVWNGELVVYMNQRAVKGTFEEVCKSVETYYELQRNKP